MPNECNWITPFLKYLNQGVLPQDPTEAGQLVRRAKSIPANDGKALLLDIHTGICGHHVALRALVGKAFRHGFYWTTVLADAKDLVRTCRGCQFFAR
jgi:hypothetical protein